jgi:hypothetical protein
VVHHKRSCIRNSLADVLRSAASVIAMSFLLLGPVERCGKPSAMICCFEGEGWYEQCNQLRCAM